MKIKSTAVILAALAALFLTSSLYGAPAGSRPLSDPPVFTNAANVPDTLTFACLKDVPNGEKLEATDDNDPAFPQLIAPVDNPLPSSINGCTGGSFERVWTATDLDGNVTTLTQVIIVLPDTAPPVTTAVPVNDILPCEAINYSAWLAGVQLAFLSNTTDNCSAIGMGLNFSNNAPPTRPPGCGTLTIQFTATDACNNTLNWPVTLTATDTIKPVLVGIPLTDTIRCDQPLPPLPVVTATDNCSGDVDIVFTEVNNRAVNPADCGHYQYQVVRSWVATDACGNRSSASQIIRVLDDAAPDFTRPANITILCTDDSNDLGLTGNLSNITDNCSAAFATSSYQNQISPGNCPGNYTLQRLWRVQDVCNNSTVKIQVITVKDTVPPSFTVPADISIRCDQNDNPTVTGFPTGITDNCQTGGTILPPSDVLLPGACVNSYTIRRTWTVRDSCGNEASQIQLIFVSDSIAPVVQDEAQNLEVFCASNSDYQAAFTQWIQNRGGATASDNCTFSGDLVWSAFNAGTNDPAALPAVSCPAADSVVLSQTVIFVVTDECGNRDSTTAVFRVIDNLPPFFVQCPSDMLFPTDPGQCSALVELIPPVIGEDCGFGILSETASDQQPITSNAAPDQLGSTPVNAIDLNIPIGLPQPLNTAGPATLSVSLFSADAEGATEFFFIYDENGNLLDSTAYTPAQCGDSNVDILITPQQLDAWAADGVVRIRLEPNIPSGMSGAFAVNAVCINPGSARATLSYSARDLNGLRYEYSIDNGPRAVVNPPSPIAAIFDPGAYLITYYATDCAGNQDSCSHFIVVEDLEAPVLTCPADITVSAGLDSCSAVVTLPLPVSVSDNCSVGAPFSQIQPTINTNALLTFEYDPNLNDRVAQPKIYTFTGVAANATEDAVLSIIAQGDFNTNGAFVRVFGEDNTLLGTTTQGFANCDTAGQVAFTIPQALFNNWASDGQLSIRIVPNPILVPPGLPGDGINPCNPAEVTFDGDTDGESYVFAQLEYAALEVAYFSTGATILPPTPLSASAPVTHEFVVGTTEIFYTTTDRAGNSDTCSYRIIVQDTQRPVAACRPSIVYVNPSGVSNQSIDPALIDNGSTDNCGIASLSLSPNIFSCNQAGMSFPITLTATDMAGNTDTCSTLIRIEMEAPQPTANSGICGGDTLFLFANPPAAQGGIIYTFQWSGPQGFVSNLENPVIPNIDPARAGSYMVTISGISGCTVSGTVEVAIENLPLIPLLVTDTEICTNENIVLSSGIVVPGQGAVYNWYEGLPPNGTLLASTNAPELILPGPQTVGQRRFYLTLESGPCVTAPSVPVTVSVFAIPVAVVNEEQITICQGQPLQLGTNVSGPGMTYQWRGPNFMSANQSPVVSPAAGPGTGGIYTLRVTQNGCTSAPDTTTVTVLPKPATPILGSSGPACEGSTILLTASTPASQYRWIPPGGGTPIVTTVNVLLLQNVTSAVAGPWRVFVTQFGCDSDVSAPLEVVVNPIPQVSVEASAMSVCEGQPLQLFASPILANGQYAWSGPLNFSSNQRTPLLSPMTLDMAGTYSVTVTTAAGCFASASVAVQVLPRPVITGLSNDGTACIASPFDVQFMATLSPPSGNYTFEWSGPCQVMAAPSGGMIPGATTSCNGAYQLIVRNEFGCASLPATTFVNLTNAPATPMTPVITSGNAGAVCAGQQLILTTSSYTGNSVTYYWQTPAGLVPTSTPSLTIAASTLADSGPYSVFVEVDGCPSSPSGLINVVVSPVPVIVASSNSPVCAGQTIQFNSNFIPAGIYQWTGLNNGFTSAISNPSISNADSLAHSGAYVVTVSRNGCISNPDTVFVLVRNRPMRPVALAVAPVCISEPGARVIFSVAPASATPGASYDWFDQNNTQIGVSAGLDFQFNNFAPYGEGTFQFFVRARKDGCVSALSEPVFVTFNTIPSQPPFAGEDATVCPNQDIFLNAAAPPRGSGVWTLTAGGTGNEVIESPAQAGSQVTGLLMGQTYTFRWTLSNGACVNYGFDEMDISVRQIETAQAGVDTTICPGQPFELYATSVAIDTGRWSQPDIQALFGVMIQDSSAANTAVTGMTSGNQYLFVWTVSGACGILRDSVIVSLSDVQPRAGDDFRACNDEQFAVLRAQSPGQGSMGLWSSPDTTLRFSNATAPDATVFGLSEGQNMLIWSIDAGLCGAASVDTLIVTWSPNPVAENDTIEVNFGEQSLLYVWANDFIPSGTTIRIISPPQFGTTTIVGDTAILYTPDLNFTGADQLNYEICSEGCECAIATVFIRVSAGSLCNPPTVITPNGDKVNDQLVIPCLFDTQAFPRSQVLVFNRWGDEVFRSSIPYRNNWEGTFNGEDLPPGTYFYIINYGDGTVPKTGYLMILR